MANSWRDPFTHSCDESDDRESLQRHFVESVIHNVENVHSVTYLTEDHDNGDGTHESEYLVKVVFSNQVGQTCHVDGILETFNTRDRRMIADRFQKRVLEDNDWGPEEFDWPTPDVHTTITSCPDKNDYIKDYTLVWATDKRTWDCLQHRHETTSYEVVEVCPHCDAEVVMRWDVDEDGFKAFCPYCGKELMLCDECMHADDNPNMDCTEPCFRKKTGKCKGKCKGKGKCR